MYSRENGRLVTSEQFCERVLEIENYVNRTGFGCSRDCPHDFFWHGEALIRFLTTFIEAEFYEEPSPEFEYPNCPCDLKPRFDAEAARFQEKWKC